MELNSAQIAESLKVLQDYYLCNRPMQQVMEGLFIAIRKQCIFYNFIYIWKGKENL